MDDEAVAAQWSALLDGQPVGVDDDFFFDLGGHSLLGAAIVTRLAVTTGLPLELRDLYLAPTPREFAGYLGELRRRLDELRAQVPAGREWSVDAFVAALVELGPAAADSLLPPDATVRLDPGPHDPDQARIAVLRQARGNGSCELLDGPCIRLRRGDTVVALTVEPGPAGVIVRFAEEARVAADPG